MRVLFGKSHKALVVALALLCLVLAGVSAQAQPDRRAQARQDRVRAAQIDAWRNQQDWRRYQQRNFGRVVVQPRRGESLNDFRSRVITQCNLQWDRSARRCNAIRNPMQRAACVSNINNALNECRAGW